MKAIITVLGKDQVGIIAGVSSLLAKWNVNVLDISQTILQENFTMVMLADLENCSLSFTELTEKLSAPRRGDEHCDPHAAGGHLQRNAQDLSGEGKNHAKPQ